MLPTPTSTREGEGRQAAGCLGHPPCLPAEKSNKTRCLAPLCSIPAILLHQLDFGTVQQGMSSSASSRA